MECGLRCVLGYDMSIENSPCGEWQELMDSFAEGWEESGDGQMVLYGENRENFYTFEDLGKGPGLGERQLVLWLDDNAYVLKQEKGISPEEGIQTYIIFPPYKEEYFDHRDNWSGIYYGPDGKMDPVRRVKGLPLKIDMEKTIELFIKQVAEKRFTVPVLVRQIKK